MSVYLRGKSYHYRFLFKGKDYSGVCSGCSTEGRAKEYERSIREKIRREAETLSAEEEKIRQNKTIRALVDNYSFQKSRYFLLTYSQSSFSHAALVQGSFHTLPIPALQVLCGGYFRASAVGQMEKYFIIS